jgi:hypothetical protein
MKDSISSSHSEVGFTVTLKLTEQEARALTVLPSYGTKQFIKMFYENMGRHYLQPHEQGIISLFSKIEKELPQHLRKFDEVRKILNENFKK